MRQMSFSILHENLQKQMDTFSDLTTFTYQGEKYKTSDGGGDGVMNFGFYEVSKKDYKTAFWLKDTMSKQDKKIAKIIPWWKGQAEPVYTIPSKSGCKMVFIDPDHDMIQIKKEAKNVKQKYNISGDSKDKVAYVDFDIMTVGGKEYVGKEEEW